MTNFRNLKIWQRGMQLVTDVYELASCLPKEEKYTLRSQITRSAISIPSNIAEGSSRNSKKDFVRFLEIALGSAFELETQLLVIAKLKLVKEEPVKQLVFSLREEQKRINGLIRSQKQKSNT
ncbi:MAG: four helix bundle protein [Calditrichaeota bacterium]|nr:MAG: four helix bundle protein [Calditrichota bacterium]